MAAAIAERAGRWRLVDPQSGWSQETIFETTLDLSDDYGDVVLPENVITAVEEALDRGETHYTNRAGVPALREAVARKLSGEQSFNVDPTTEVVITCGGREGMFLALQVLIQPGDEVLVPDLRPTFIDEAIRLAGGILIPVSLLAKEGFEMQASQIQERLTDKTRLLVLVNPSNPTGAVISAEEMARIGALVQERDLKVVSDEVLDESLDGDVRHTSIASFPEMAQRTVVVGSFSKLHGLASWRVGYLSGPKALVTPIRDLKQAMTICTSAMSQYAALEAMTGLQDWLVRRRDALDTRRQLVLRALDDMGLPHSRPHATPFVFVDVRSSGRSSGDFAAWLLSNARVAVMPGSRFGDQGEGYIRLPLWSTLSELEQAMRRMKWALNQASRGAQ